jgi:diadenylate cyclase
MLMGIMSNFFNTLYNEYLTRFGKIKITDIIEIIILWIVIYMFIKWVKTTRAWTLIWGLLMIVLFWGAAKVFDFNVILAIFGNALTFILTALIVIFQPELRKALEKLGQISTGSFSTFNYSKKKQGDERFSDETIDELVGACTDLARDKTGALMVIEMTENVDEYIKSGITLNADITRQLLINIFEHNTPLHDGAVIIRGDKIIAATCYLPLSDNMKLSKDLGTRHRAGVGMSEATDSFVMIVSEETGQVSVAYQGKLDRALNSTKLRQVLKKIQISGEKKQDSIVKRITKRLLEDDEEIKNEANKNTL